MAAAVLYIGGAGRSGSTLLARMLGRTPGVVAVGELRYVLERGVRDNHLCGCGQPFRECAFWTEVFDRAMGGLSLSTTESLMTLARGVDRNREIPALSAARLRTSTFRHQLHEYTEFLSRLYAAIAEVSGAKLIVDSSKDPSYAFVLQNVREIELTVLHLVRDSRAVAFSWTRAKIRPEVHWQVERMQTRRALRTAILWTEYNLLFGLLHRRTARFRRMRYEDLVTDPDASLAAITAWTLVDEASSVAAGADDIKPFPHDISGNPLRFATTPLVVREDIEWRHAMGRRDRRIVTLVTAPLLARYGYLGRRRSATSSSRG